MPKRSAGLLVYRTGDTELEVFLVHPGGPFWQKKDDGAWSIPKGLIGEGEDPLEAAKREFFEETCLVISAEDYEPLMPVKQPGGKIVQAWSIEAELDADSVRSNSFLLEWPPKSGTICEFPEMDRAAWFPISVARRKILKGQAPLLDELERNRRRGVGDRGE